MSYSTSRNTLIARRGYSGLSGFLDTIKNVASGAITFYGDQRQAQGAASAQPAAAPGPLVAAPAPSSGISTTTLVIGGVAVAGLAFVLLSKKKA